jgi:hypothetical protein
MYIPKGGIYQQLKTKALQPFSPLDALTLKWVDVWRSHHWVACVPAGSALRWNACRTLANLRWGFPSLSYTLQLHALLHCWQAALLCQADSVVENDTWTVDVGAGALQPGSQCAQCHNHDH